MTHSSHNSKTSSVERKINKEFNIDEIKEAEIENTEKEDSEHEEKIIKIIESPHYIGDGEDNSQVDEEYNLQKFSVNLFAINKKLLHHQNQFIL